MRADGHQIGRGGLRALWHGGSLTGLTDGQLLERYSLGGGDAEAAFAALVARHGGTVWRTCRSVLRDDHDASDAFQATFLVLVRKARSLWICDSLAPWLYRVAFRAAVEAERARSRRRRAEDHAAGLRPTTLDDRPPDDLAAAIHAEVDRLPERHRAPVVLCDLEGRSLEDAARALGCPVGTVKSRLARARDRLRESLRRRGLDPSASPALVIGPAAVTPPPPEVASAAIRLVGMPSRALAIPEPVVRIAKGVTTAMDQIRITRSFAAATAALAVLAAGWLAQAAPGPMKEEPRAEPPAQASAPAIDLDGNWIVRGYPSGEAFGIIEIEDSRKVPRARLVSLWSTASEHSAAKFLSVMPSASYRLADSSVQRFRVEDGAVRFGLDLVAARPIDRRTSRVVALLPAAAEARPDVLWGSIQLDDPQGETFVIPARLERTARDAIDPAEADALAPWAEEFRLSPARHDLTDFRRFCERMLRKYAGSPLEPIVGVNLACCRADADAPEQEIRKAFEAAVRSSRRFGRELEIWIRCAFVDAVVGNPAVEALVLENARRAASMLRPADPPNLQVMAMKRLRTALRKARSMPEAEARAELKGVEDRLAAVQPQPADTMPWARTFESARATAKAQGKLVMADLLGHAPDVRRRLDRDIFPGPEVQAAMRSFVPVRIDADGEGRPLLSRYRRHISGFPAILVLDPSIEAPKDAQIIGRILGYVPASVLADRLQLVAGLPRDVGRLREELKTRPDDVDRLRRLAVSLAMRGNLQEAAAIAARAPDASKDPGFDRWSALYLVLGEDALLDVQLDRASAWFVKAAAIAKRPVDAFAAHLGAGFAAGSQGKHDLLARELAGLSATPDIPGDDIAHARELLGRFVAKDEGPAAR